MEQNPFEKTVQTLLVINPSCIF